MNLEKFTIKAMRLRQALFDAHATYYSVDQCKNLVAKQEGFENWQEMMKEQIAMVSESGVQDPNQELTNDGAFKIKRINIKDAFDRDPETATILFPAGLIRSEREMMPPTHSPERPKFNPVRTNLRRDSEHQSAKHDTAFSLFSHHGIVLARILSLLDVSDNSGALIVLSSNKIGAEANIRNLILDEVFKRLHENAISIIHFGPLDYQCPKNALVKQIDEASRNDMYFGIEDYGRMVIIDGSAGDANIQAAAYFASNGRKVIFTHKAQSADDARNDILWKLHDNKNATGFYRLEDSGRVSIVHQFIDQ